MWSDDYKMWLLSLADVAVLVYGEVDYIFVLTQVVEDVDEQPDAEEEEPEAGGQAAKLPRFDQLGSGVGAVADAVTSLAVFGDFAVQFGLAGFERDFLWHDVPLSVPLYHIQCPGASPFLVDKRAHSVL